VLGRKKSTKHDFNGRSIKCFTNGTMIYKTYTIQINLRQVYLRYVKKNRK